MSNPEIVDANGFPQPGRDVAEAFEKRHDNTLRRPDASGDPDLRWRGEAK